jgi:hypothetical protein
VEDEELRLGTEVEGVPEVRSTMSQISDSVGSEQKGSRSAVPGSGITSMSLAWIACQPRIDEPSKPKPSSKEDSSSS